MKFVTQDYYEILNVAPEATNEQVKRAYRMVRQSFRPDSMAIHSLYSDAETEAISAKIDEAFRILSNPESARRYARYHRRGRVGQSVPRNPDDFFDAVHQLDASSPIEDLARQISQPEGEAQGEQEATAAQSEQKAPPAALSSQDVLVHAEVFIDTLERVPGTPPTLTLHEGGGAAIPSVGGMTLMAQSDRSVELLVTGPVADPAIDILGTVAAPRNPQVVQEGSPAAMAAAAPGQRDSGRPMITDTVRTQTRGPFEVDPLAVETLEAIEMDCGGINGLFIQQVRRELGIAMKDISVRTKIGMAMLMAIEEEDHSVFQARVYMKGYLRQICRLLHLPSREVPQRYVEQVGIE